MVITALGGLLGVGFRLFWSPGPSLPDPVERISRKGQELKATIHLTNQTLPLSFGPPEFLSFVGIISRICPPSSGKA